MHVWMKRLLNLGFLYETLGTSKELYRNGGDDFKSVHIQPKFGLNRPSLLYWCNPQRLRDSLRNERHTSCTVLIIEIPQQISCVHNIVK